MPFCGIFTVGVFREPRPTSRKVNKFGVRVRGVLPNKVIPFERQAANVVIGAAPFELMEFHCTGCIDVFSVERLDSGAVRVEHHEG